MTHKIGPYEVVRQLGQGGFGVVYEVRDPTVPRTLALKVLTDEHIDEESLQRFLREAELLARIQHRNVVRIHKVGRLHEGPFLLEEVVEGEALRAVSARGALQPEVAARIVSDVADAVAAVHAKGILHRDLKAANVILRPDGIPVLLDFGLARDPDAEKITQTGSLLGTPAYMAPEQVRGISPTKLLPSVDVWGLGVLLYELLTGVAPFGGKSVALVLRSVAKEDPIWPRDKLPHVPAPLDAIVRQAMSKDPLQRFQTAGTMRDVIDGFLAREQPPAPAPAFDVPPEPERDEEAERSTSYGAIVLIAIVVLLALAGAVLAFT